MGVVYRALDTKLNRPPIIEGLQERLAIVNQTIDTLEKFRDGRQKRGRKSMGAAERLLVSERIRRYWANKKQTPRGAGSQTSQPGAK